MRLSLYSGENTESRGADGMHTYRNQGPLPVSSRSHNYFSWMDFLLIFSSTLPGLYNKSITPVEHPGHSEPLNRLKVEKDIEKH